MDREVNHDEEARGEAGRRKAGMVIVSQWIEEGTQRRQVVGVRLDVVGKECK